MQKSEESTTAKKELYTWIRKWFPQNQPPDQEIDVDLLDVAYILECLGYTSTRVRTEDDPSVLSGGNCVVELCCNQSGVGALLECSGPCRCSTLKEYIVKNHPGMPPPEEEINKQSASIKNEQPEETADNFSSYLEVPQNTPTLCRRCSSIPNEPVKQESPVDLNAASAMLGYYEIEEKVSSAIKILQSIVKATGTPKGKFHTDTAEAGLLGSRQSKIPIPTTLHTPQTSTAEQEREGVSPKPQQISYRRSSLPLTSEVEQMVAVFSEHTSPSGSRNGSQQKTPMAAQKTLSETDLEKPSPRNTPRPQKSKGRMNIT